MTRLSRSCVDLGEGLDNVPLEGTRGKSGGGGSKEEGVVETKGKKMIREGRHEREEVGEAVVFYTRETRGRDLDRYRRSTRFPNHCSSSSCKILRVPIND